MEKQNKSIAIEQFVALHVRKSKYYANVWAINFINEYYISYIENWFVSLSLSLVHIANIAHLVCLNSRKYIYKQFFCYSLLPSHSIMIHCYEMQNCAINVTIRQWAML